MRILIVTALYVTLFIAIQLAANRSSIATELSRKCTHIIVGVTAAIAPVCLSYREIATVGLVLAAIMIITKQYGLLGAIHKVQRTTYGEILFPLSTSIVAILYPHTAPYVYGLLVLALADGFAAIIGSRYGKHRLPYPGSSKSYEGSVVFFGIAVVIGVAILALTHSTSPLTIVATSIAGGLLLTLIESYTEYGLDNLLIPPIAAAMLSAVTG